MKRCFLLILSILFLWGFSINQKPQWKGTIEDENGIKVVKNPKEPMYGDDVLSVKEELSIGEAEGREELMFSDISDIAADEEERIYILDSKKSHINVFSKNGEYLKTIGKRLIGGFNLSDLKLAEIGR
jgi:hypothetical protein